MKELISLIVTLVMFCSLFASFRTFAASEELLVNPGFDDEKPLNGWAQYAGKSTGLTGAEYGNEGNGLLISKRSAKYATYAQDITNILKTNGPGKYKVTMKARLAGEGKASGYVVINIENNGGDHTYYTSEQKDLTAKWQTFSFDKEINFNVSAGFKKVLIYPQFFDPSTDAAPDICVDSFSMKKTGKTIAENTGLTPINVANEKRSETTSVGAIRWDAWYGHNGDPQSVVSQVEKTLSPAKYHFRAPFFSSVTDEGKIEIQPYTQEIFDKEMEYAIGAGIDYFAYCWYDSDMKAARVFHTQSKYRDKVKMCCMMDGNAIGQSYAHKEMETLLKQSYYMTVLDGRPLMYYFGNNDNLASIAADIKYYRELAEKIGVKPPYAVVMNRSAADSLSICGDAVGSYAMSLSDGKSFKELTDYSHDRWESWRTGGSQLVPLVSFGWHNLPRYENPVKWTTSNAQSYVQYGTDTELREALEYALEYMQKPGVDIMTMANTVLIYAWNEHDEGGWICPTIEVDKDGKQIFNADGTPKINTGHLQAAKEAITKFRGTILDNTPDTTATAANIGGTVTSTPTSIAAPSATATAQSAEISQKRSTVAPIIIGSCIAVLAAAGCITGIVIKKKKK